MKMSILKNIFKHYWWLLLIPLIPILLNYFLPLGNWSRIGGENSPSIWLSFWASFSNSLIYCFITLVVLSRQINNDTKQNDLNRSANRQENARNRNDNITQNNLNRAITLNTIKYNTQLSQLINLIPVCSEYISLFDISEIKYLKREWLDHVYSIEYCQKYIEERVHNSKDVIYKFLLFLQASDIIDDSFINIQKNHIERLFNMLYIIRKFFSLDLNNFTSSEGYLKIIEYLNQNEFDIIFNEKSDPFWQIEFEFSEIGVNSIQLEFEYFIAKQKEKISSIINGKIENERS